ncbi:hypothetical protein ABEG17_02205 [Pedococcus sp. KACC 23699]|uniref:SPW repeat-containing protein n=1 Tax=Pedococcus sp. KACC 23699 TaxID=3149228 RepID=A0AAU7JV18_9MICO
MARGGSAAEVGVNSARGWSRIARGYAVETVGVFGAWALLTYAVGGPAWSGSDWFVGWGFVAGLLAIPLIVTGTLVVLSVRWRVAPVGLLCAALLAGWATVDAPWTGVAWWGAGFVLAPLVASLVTHPRPWSRGVGQVSSTAR